MNQGTLKKKCYKTILALTGATMIAAMPMTAEATSIPDLFTYYSTAPTYVDIFSAGITESSGVFTGTTDSWSLIGGTGGETYTSGEFHLNKVGKSFLLKKDSATPLLVGTILDELSDSSAALFSFMPVSGWLVSNGKINVNEEGLININLFSGSADTYAQAAPVPEPATMTLMFAGGSALVALRRRKSTTVA